MLVRTKRWSRSVLMRWRHRRPRLRDRGAVDAWLGMRSWRAGTPWPRWTTRTRSSFPSVWTAAQLHPPNALSGTAGRRRRGHVEAFARGPYRGERPRWRSELDEDVLEVSSDGSRSHDQRAGDLLVRTPVDQQPQHLQLARRQPPQVGHGGEDHRPERRCRRLP